jgi:hypothetical protein
MGFCFSGARIAGDVTWDENYIYAKTATGWKRTVTSAW